MAEEIELKILIIGDNSDGKSQLISNYVDGYFPSPHARPPRRPICQTSSKE